MPFTAVGVDGCRAGWVCAGWDGSHWALVIVHSLADLLPLLAPSSIVCIDMPIGLSETGVRACDQEARRKLGPRASTVFTAPPRLALDEADYAEINSECKLRFGRGVSKQAFYLLPKIRELQSILSRPDVCASHWHETHPELCFCALNNGVPMEKSKKSEAGLSERLEILEAALAGSDAMSVYSGFAARVRRARCQQDDIVDALVCGVVARCDATERRFVPIGSPECDAQGMPMQISYPAMNQLTKE